MIQPIPGRIAPLAERMAQAASRHVARMTAQHTSAADRYRPGRPAYWKLPIIPSTRPSRNSTP